MTIIKRLAITIVLSGLSGCGEYNGYLLVNPETQKRATCIVPWGRSLPAETIQRLHQCIEVCESRGFRLKDPARVPPPVPFVKGARPPTVPLECQSVVGT
jgi:hypothetical protein